MACDKAAMNESLRRTHWPYVEGLSETRTKSQGIFNILKERGRPVSTGIPIPPWHVELSGTRKLRENATANQELALAA